MKKSSITLKHCISTINGIVELADKGDIEAIFESIEELMARVK